MVVVTVENQNVSTAWQNAIHVANKFKEIQNLGTKQELRHPHFDLHYHCGSTFTSFKIVSSKLFSPKDVEA